MYGVFKEGIIAHDAINEHLCPYRYAPVKITQGLWTHKDKDINFNLVIDRFVIIYTKKPDANHLVAALKDKYEVTQ